MFKVIKNKKLRIFIIILLILVVLGFIINSIIGVLKDNYRNFYKVNDELVLEQTYDIKFNEIDIETKMTDIYIKQSEDDTIKILLYGEKDYITLNEKNNKLFIDTNEKNYIVFDFYSFVSKIELYLPKEYSELIRIDSEYGNIEIDNFINSTLYVDQEYGSFISLGLDFIKIDNYSGNVELKEATKARVSASSSDIKIGTVKDLEVENEYGDIEIESVDEYLKLSNESGNIKINNVVLEKDSYIESKYGDIEINTINEIYIDAKSDHGKVEVKNNNKESDIVLKIHNKSGDININN